MARKKPTGKAVLVLLVLCLLMGAGGAGVRAGEGSGAQLVLVLDSANPTGDSQMHSLLPQAASLLVHLLGDQFYLGLVGSGQPDGVLLPTARLSPEHRKQALDTLADFAPAPDQGPPGEVMQQALSAFQPQGPKRRVLFWLAGDGGVFPERQNDDAPPQTEQIIAQARSAEVNIFAALMTPAAAWHTLTLNTGGRFWEVKSASDLHIPCLRLYQHLAQPQEAPLNGSQVRLDRWVKQAVMVITRAAPGKGVVLTNARKARITKRTRAKSIRWVAGRSCDLITLTRPRPGVWSFKGARSEVCKVFLSTDLILTAAGTPTKVGEDEALLVTAALRQANEAPADPDLLAGTQFAAELHLHDTRLTATLKKASPGQAPELTPDVRTGRFPPLYQEGQGTLRLTALGDNFQRLRSLPLTITKPWYRVDRPVGEARVKLSLRFKPGPGPRPEQVQGTLTLKSVLGSLSGVFINPAPGAEIVLDRTPGCQDPCLADLHLSGTAPDGHPLDITSGPLRLEYSRSAPDKAAQPPVKPGAPEQVQGTIPSSLTPKLRPQWIWLALCAVGGAIILVSAFLLWRLRREDAGLEDDEDFGGASGNNILRLKAQVETLIREKGGLEAELKEKTKEIKQLHAEKAELQTDLERSQEKSQAHLKTLHDVEKKLEETEQEAKRVKQEYMALYARNQREQETLKKN